MSKIEIKTNNTKAYGQKRQFPIDGEVTIGEDGVVEVSEECAKLLVEGGNFFYADEEDDTEELNAEGGDNEEEEGEGEDGEDEENSGDGSGEGNEEFASDEEVMKFLEESFDFTTLKKLAVKNKLDKADKKAFKAIKSKVAMLTYIKANLSDDIRGAVTELLQ